MIEFEFKDNFLYLNHNNKETMNYSDFIRVIYNGIYQNYDVFERFERYDKIDNDLKNIMEQYNGQGLKFVEAPGSLYIFGSIKCINKDIYNEIIEKLHAYIIMMKLMQ